MNIFVILNALHPGMQNPNLSWNLLFPSIVISDISLFSASIYFHPVYVLLEEP